MESSRNLALSLDVLNTIVVSLYSFDYSTETKIAGDGRLSYVRGLGFWAFDQLFTADHIFQQFRHDKEIEFWPPLINIVGEPRSRSTMLVSEFQACRSDGSPRFEDDWVSFRNLPFDERPYIKIADTKNFLSILYRDVLFCSLTDNIRPSVHRGFISNYKDTDCGSMRFVVDGPVIRGSSGSPIVDIETGEVMGILVNQKMPRWAVGPMDASIIGNRSIIRALNEIASDQGVGGLAVPIHLLCKRPES